MKSVKQPAKAPASASKPTTSAKQYRTMVRMLIDGEQVEKNTVIDLDDTGDWARDMIRQGYVIEV